VQDLKIGSGAKCWLESIIGAPAWRWLGEHIGQNVLQSSFETESISSHNFLGIFFLIAPLNAAIIRYLGLGFTLLTGHEGP
jgi:hypothetical protein